MIKKIRFETLLISPLNSSLFLFLVPPSSSSSSFSIGTKPGENVASELAKLWVKGKLTRGGRKEEEEEEEEEEKESTTTTTTTTEEKEYNLMAKFNCGNEMDREYVRYIQTDLNELLIYSHVIDELNAFQQRVGGGKYPVYVPEFVYGVCEGEEYVLVMQDIGVLG